MLLEWRTKQALEYESKAKKFRNEEIFQDNQMVYLLAPHASALQMNTTKIQTRLYRSIIHRHSIG